MIRFENCISLYIGIEYQEAIRISWVVLPHEFVVVIAYIYMRVAFGWCRVSYADGNGMHQQLPTSYCETRISNDIPSQRPAMDNF